MIFELTGNVSLLWHWFQKRFDFQRVLLAHSFSSKFAIKRSLKNAKRMKKT